MCAFVFLINRFDLSDKDDFFDSRTRSSIVSPQKFSTRGWWIDSPSPNCQLSIFCVISEHKPPGIWLRLNIATAEKSNISMNIFFRSMVNKVKFFWFLISFQVFEILKRTKCKAKYSMGKSGSLSKATRPPFVEWPVLFSVSCFSSRIWRCIESNDWTRWGRVKLK